MTGQNASKIASPLVNRIARDGDWNAAPASPDDTLEVEVHAAPDQFDAALDHANSVVETTKSNYGNTIIADVRADAIAKLANSDAVRKVEENLDPKGLSTSEGVTISNADQLHNKGLTGDGTQVAIIDHRFDISNDKIKDNIVGTIGDSQYYYTESADGSDRLGHHGTACAEVVVDMAPDCDLVLATTLDNNLSLFDILDELETNWNPDVASMSLGYPPINRLDGLDDRSHRVDDFTDNGRIFATSAGNEADGSHWYGQFADTDGNGWMEFDDSGSERLRIDNPYGEAGYLIVQWDADWDLDDERYEVYLYDQNDNILDSSYTTEPVETIYFDGSNDPIYVAIENVDASGTEVFDCFLWGPYYAEFTNFTRNRSLLIPATSRDSETFTTAAVQATDWGIESSAEELKRYSSRGPTQDGRQGIDIAGPSKVSQLDSENDGFKGTSAAAPHVAGAAALLSDFSAATNTEIRESMRSPDRDIEDTDVGLPTNIEIGSSYLEVMDSMKFLAGLKERWSVKIGGSAQATSVAVDDQQVYFGGLDQKLSAHERTKGDQVWSFTRDGALSDSSPAVQNGTVFIGSGGGKLYARDAADGGPIWTFSNDSAITSSPAVTDSGGAVIFGTNDGRVISRSVSDGSNIWSTDVGGPVYSDLATANGLVFVTTNDGRLLCLDTSNGSVYWEFDTGTELGASSPTIGNGSVYLSADNVYAFDASSSKSKQWEQTYGGTAGSSPAYKDSTLYVGSATGDLYALDTDANGAVVWSHSIGQTVAADPEVVGDRVVAPSFDGRLHVFLVSDGTELGSTALPSETQSAPTITGTEHYIGTQNGEIVKLDTAGFNSAIYGLNECSGDTVGDSGEPGRYDGTIVGSPNWVNHFKFSDECGLEFDGTTGNYVEFPVNSDPNSALTFAVVVEFDGTSMQLHGTWGNRLNIGDGRFYMGVSSSDNVQYGFGQRWERLSYSWSTNDPVVLTLTAEPQGNNTYAVDYYFHNELIDSVETDYLLERWNPVRVGAINNDGVDSTSKNLDGRIYETHLYNESFDASDVKQLIQETTGENLQITTADTTSVKDTTTDENDITESGE